MDCIHMLIFTETSEEFLFESSSSLKYRLNTQHVFVGDSRSDVHLMLDQTLQLQGIK